MAGSGFATGGYDASMTFSPASKGISSSSAFIEEVRRLAVDESRSDLVAQADLLYHRLQCAEVTLQDESAFWAKERAVLVEKLRFAVEREEAKQQRLEVALAELREQHDHASRFQERFRAENEETILTIQREFEHKLHIACDERDRAVFDCENLAKTLRSIEEDVGSKRSTWQNALDKSQDDQQRLTGEIQRWQQRHDELRQELLRLEDLASEERRKWSVSRDEVERQAQLVLDEKTQEWNRQVQQIISEREEWRRQRQLMEGERDAWHDRHTSAESECHALARQVETSKINISKLEGRGRQEELEAEELRLRIDKCEIAQSSMRESETSIIKEALNCEQILRQEVRDAVYNQRCEQESFNAHCSQLVWRLESAKAQDDLESQKFIHLEHEYASERHVAARLQYELTDEQGRAKACIERLEKDTSLEMQAAADQHKRVVADLEKRILNSEDRGLQLQRNASDAERHMQQALYVERELRAELRQKDLAHQDQVLLLEEVMSDTKLLAKNLATHQKQASYLNETIRHSAEIVERSMSPSPRLAVSSPPIAPNSPSKSIRGVDIKSEERPNESLKYGVHSSYMASLTAKYASDNALNALSRASKMEKRYRNSDRLSNDRLKSQAVINNAMFNTPLRASESSGERNTSPRLHSSKRIPEDNPVGSPALRPIRYAEETGLQGYLRGPRLGPDRPWKRQGPEVVDSWQLKGSSSTGSLRALG